MQGVRARHDAVLAPFISFVRSPQFSSHIGPRTIIQKVKFWSFWGSDLFTGMLCAFCLATIGRLLFDSVEIPQNHQRTKCTEHASTKIRPSKIGTSVFPEWCTSLGHKTLWMVRLSAPGIRLPISLWGLRIAIAGCKGCGITVQQGPGPHHTQRHKEIPPIK